MHTNFSMHRVKVYKLNAEGQWEDKGTGHISVEYMEQAHAMGLVVISEDEGRKTLLVHQISREDIYARSGESTIITWHDSEISTDVAISFQEQVGCDDIWQQIKQVQQEEHMRHQDHERSRKSTADEYDQPAAGGAHMGNGDFADGDVELPAPERPNLEEIAKVLSHVQPFQRDRVAAQLMKQNYLPALLDLFKRCEDLEDSEGLTHMYTIVRNAIMLNDSSVLEEMLREEHVMDVLGALEFDPDVKQPQKHREFLQSHVQFKEVVPISNAQILARIHQTYRIQYLKDVILPRSLDDATYTTLSSLALFNNIEVVSSLMSDPAFLPHLFQRLRQTNPSDVQWHDLVAFLQEFCSLARHLQQPQRASLFNRLIQLGLFEVVSRIMQHSAEDVKLRATDILMSSMQHDVLALREFLYKQEKQVDQEKLFGLLVHELTDGRDSGLAEQVCETIKLLMDPDTMEKPVEKNEFLEVFYDKYLDKLLDVIVSDTSINPTGTRIVPATTLGLILELISFCVQHHSYRIRYFTLRKHLVETVLRLLHRRERWLVCATVRFVRTCVSLKDDFWTRHLLRFNCFGPLMVVFFENGERYNLLNSAVLDLIEFILKENIKPLLEHLVETYGHRFEDLSYVKTFKQLRLRYEQAPERAGSGAIGPGVGRGDEEMADASGAEGALGTAAAAIRGRTYLFSNSTGSLQTRAAAHQAHGRRRRRDERDLEKDEEDYFSEDADDEQEDVARPQPHPQHHSDQALRDSGSSSYQAGYGSNKDLGSRNDMRGNNTNTQSGPSGQGVANAAGPVAAEAVNPDGEGGEPAAGPAHADGLVTKQQPPQSATARTSPARQKQSLQRNANPAGSHEAPRQWPGLVDYEDDDDAPEGQQPQSADVSVKPSCSDSVSDRRPGRDLGRSPGRDLGRRPRSEPDQTEERPSSDAAGDGSQGQEQRKRLRNNELGGPPSGPEQ